MRAVKVAVLGLIAAMAMAAPAMAGTLDQSQTQFNGGFAVGSGFDEAQTFTAGLSGGLDQADLLLSRYSNACVPDVDLTVEIRTVVSQIPSDVVLASAIVPASSIPAAASPDFVPVLFASPADVVAGTRYALVASANDPDCGYVWWGSDADPYSGGTRAVRSSEPAWQFIPGEDLAFRTYVLTATCSGQVATQVGTDGNDVIEGTTGRDVIAALGGKDIVRGLGDNDRICGGRGNDTLKGGAGKDRLNGGGGTDKCVGGPGADSASRCEVERSA